MHGVAERKNVNSPIANDGNRNVGSRCAHTRPWNPNLFRRIIDLGAR